MGMAVFCDCYTVPDICSLLWSQGLCVWGPDEHGGATQAPPKHHRAFSLGQGGSPAVEQQNHLEGSWKRGLRAPRPCPRCSDPTGLGPRL